jgi:hypothetical protein
MGWKSGQPIQWVTASVNAWATRNADGLKHTMRQRPRRPARASNARASIRTRVGSTSPDLPVSAFTRRAGALYLATANCFSIGINRPSQNRFTKRRQITAQASVGQAFKTNPDNQARVHSTLQRALKCSWLWSPRQASRTPPARCRSKGSNMTEATMSPCGPWRMKLPPIRNQGAGPSCSVRPPTLSNINRIISLLPTNFFI